MFKSVRYFVSVRLNESLRKITNLCGKLTFYEDEDILLGCIVYHRISFVQLSLMNMNTNELGHKKMC